MKLFSGDNSVLMEVSRLIYSSHSNDAGAVVGGTQNLTEALMRCIEHHGGEVRNSTFMYPGGGLTGGGRPAAIRIMEDLGINHSHVITS